MLYPESAYAGPGDKLAVVQLDALHVLAAHEVLQGGVRDEGAVVQLQHAEGLGGTVRSAQVPDTLIRDQLTVRQRLEV